MDRLQGIRCSSSWCGPRDGSPSRVGAQEQELAELRLVELRIFDENRNFVAMTILEGQHRGKFEFPWAGVERPADSA